MSEEKTGPELVKEVGQLNTLDVLLDRQPDKYTDDDFRHMIETERKNRALWITVQEQKKEKKDAQSET